MEILQIEDLSFCYPNTAVAALTDLNLSVERGEFVVVCGESGCGKTTLLRLLKKELIPAGEQSGSVRYCGTPVGELDDRTSAARIGFVMQDPDSQIVTDRVWHELAFGAENLGIPSDVIRRRAGEMAAYFGIDGWFRQSTDTLSGGQKQLLNLASVILLQPELLILDEPTAQLDPIAAADFIATLHRLNRELGLTVILSEHRLEEVFPIADKILLMDGGRVLLYEPPRAVGRRLSERSSAHPMLAGLPSAVRICSALGEEGDCPLTVREGRDYLESRYTGAVQPAESAPSPDGELRIELRDVWFRYEKDSPDVLRGASLQVKAGEIFALLGGNGAGKTTALNLIAGLSRPYRGKVLVDGKPIDRYKGGSLYQERLAQLPQNPRTLFLQTTVEADLTAAAAACPTDRRADELRAVVERLGIGAHLSKHPYDLSGGELQLCALAMLLLRNPRVLLLDEPTKGLDAAAKRRLCELLNELAAEGTAILTVTHDVEFAAECAHRCALFFDGQVLSADAPARFFGENNFYTTAASRMARGLWRSAVTCGQVIDCARAESAGKRGST